MYSFVETAGFAQSAAMRYQRMLGVSALDDLEDDALVRHTLAGDPDAFGALVGRYQARVIAICAQITGDYDQSSDLAQEAFVAAYMNLSRYEPGRSFFVWLYRIAVNKALNYRNRRPPAPLQGEVAESVMTNTPDTAPSPEDQVERKELARKVQAGMAQLPPDYATVLALRYGADMDYTEIADTLNVPMGTVKARLFRAKALLRDLLQSWNEADFGF